MADADTAWTQEHFIGGHPALDLANSVFNRRVPELDNELLKSNRDVGNWLRAAGLADDLQADAVAGVSGGALAERVREIRVASASIFRTLAAGASPTGEALGLLFSRAASGLSAESVELTATGAELTLPQWEDPEAVPAFLAILAIEAFFVLPRERLRSCPRCGWLFVDSSRGGRRRWCSMRTCGNREKVSRHRENPDI